MRRSLTRLPRFGFILVCFFCLAAVHLTHAQDTMVLPQGQIEKAYSAQVNTEGGMPPLTWQLISGELPPGLRLSGSGKIEGTPTAAKRDPYTFELSVSDSSQPAQTAMQRSSIMILGAPLRITGVASEQTQLRIVGASAHSAPPSSAAPAASNGPPASVTQPTVQSSSQQDTAGEVSNAGSRTPKDAAAGDSKWWCPTDSQNSGSKSDTTGVSGGPMLRTIVGFEQAGVSAAQSKQDFFFDLFYERPLGFCNDRDLGPALRSWGNLRISSVPQQITTDVATFAASFAQQVGQLKINQVAQAFEFLGGIEYRFWSSPKNPKYYNSTDPQNDPEVGTRVSAGLILGGGVITPLSPRDSVQIFNVPSNQRSFFTHFPQAAGEQFVAFTLPDRNRFFRQAYGGLRIKTHFLGDTSRTRFPETFDLTYGFNEAVTGGKIRGGVIRLEGFVPIPYSKASWIYLFGTGLFKPGGHATISSPFLLAAAPPGTLPTDPNAVVIPTPQADRDYYRVGIGIDFISLVAGLKK